MNQIEIEENIKKVVEHCRNLTLRLARLSSDGNKIEGIASGFLISLNDSHYLISAGHALEKNRWVIETDLTIENEYRTACIPINTPWTLKKMTLGKLEFEGVDIAWAKIDLSSFQQSVAKDARLKGKKFEFLVYQGPLEDEPNPKEPHVFASLNRGTILNAFGRTYLERKFSYEFEMMFKGRREEDGLYVFSIPEHKGHEYYSGASGSPIIEPSGKVVSILVKGCKSKNELYGFPLAGIIQLIKIGTEVERVGPPDR